MYLLGIIVKYWHYILFIQDVGLPDGLKIHVAYMHILTFVTIIAQDK